VTCAEARWNLEVPSAKENVNVGAGDVFGVPGFTRIGEVAGESQRLHGHWASPIGVMDDAG
jgi:hypothetical protein